MSSYAMKILRGNRVHRVDDSIKYDYIISNKDYFANNMRFCMFFCLLFIVFGLGYDYKEGVG